MLTRVISLIYIMVTMARLMQNTKLLQFDLFTHSLDNYGGNSEAGSGELFLKHIKS